MQLIAQRHQFSKQHRFATSQHHVIRLVLADQINNLGNGQVVAFGLPRRVGSIAVPAAQVAARRPHKNAWRSGEQPFPLYRFVDFSDSHNLLPGRQQSTRRCQTPLRAKIPTCQNHFATIMIADRQKRAKEHSQ